MKSFLDHALAIYETLFLVEGSTLWPALSASLEKDLSYLRRAVESRGLPFLTITLPAFGKVFDRALDQGYLDYGSFPKGISHGPQSPKFLSGILELVFDTDVNVLRSDADCLAVLFIRQVTQTCKKMELPCAPQYLEDSLNEFYSIEEHLPPPHEGTWDSDIPFWQQRVGHPIWGLTRRSQDQTEFPFEPSVNDSEFPWDTLRSLCRRFTSELGVVDWWSIEPKHGPGAVADKKGEFTSKYEFPNWPRKLQSWFPFDWFGTGDFNVPDTFPDDREPPSLLHAVPKTQKGPRLICAEPIAHQWIQQGIWRWLEGRLPSTFLRGVVNFRSQEESRKRALAATCGSGHSTIDLSSASDRLGCRLVEYVFQGSTLLDGLHASRTRLMMQTISPRWPKVIKLRKFAPQGSGTTFPIQSIVYAILSIWALRLVDGKAATFDGLAESCREVTVFGDDIIVPARAHETTIAVLHSCGLKVNIDKSYANGTFAESCGMDAFRGVDVTPARILQPYDGSPSSLATVIATANNFHKKGWWRIAEVIVRQIPLQERKLLPVTSDEVDGLGLWSFCGDDWTHLKQGWDQWLQHGYSTVLQITSKVKRKPGTGISGLTQYFTEKPASDWFNPIQYQSGAVQRPSLRKMRGRVLR